MRQIIVTFAALLLSTAARAQYNISYDVTPDTAGHYLDITMHYEPQGERADTLALKMPVWAPGYYLVVDYPKYVVDFAAATPQGEPLAWAKRGKNEWRVATGGRPADVTYRVWADMRSVAESRVEPRMAFIAPNGVFMHRSGDIRHSVRVTLHRPTTWASISTGLKSVAGQADTYEAPDFDVLYDSPILMGNHRVIHFTHEGHEYEFALETPDGIDESPFTGDFKRMVSAATRLIGHVPYDRYCLIHLGAGGGGLEHANSQACYTSGTYRFATKDEYLRHLSFTTHEYFHLYNIKSIRPIELGPFDYDRECFTPMLWVSEGLTVYYESRLLLDAGLVDGAYVRQTLADFIRTIETTGGHRHMSLRQSSYDIWLNFFNRAANGTDTRISYYDKGPILGLLTDIDIRHKSHGQRSLDDLMRLLYRRYYQELQRGFTEEDFWAAAREVAGEELTLMRRYVDTTDEIDYDAALAPAGLRLDRATWQLLPVEHPTKEAKAIRDAMRL